MRFAVHADAPPHALHQTLANHQAKPRAAELAGCRCIYLGKVSKQLAQCDFGDPDARVLHLKKQPIATDPDAHPDFARPREFDGIACQVKQDLPDAKAVSQVVAIQSGVKVNREGNAFLFGPHGQYRRNGVRQHRHRERMQVIVHAPRLNLGQIENVIDDGEQRFARHRNVMRKTALLSIQLGIQQQPRHANHTIHRRANFMRHIGKKLGFFTAGTFGAFSGLPARPRIQRCCKKRQNQHGPRQRNEQKTPGPLVTDPHQIRHRFWQIHLHTAARQCPGHQQ